MLFFPGAGNQSFAQTLSPPLVQVRPDMPAWLEVLLNLSGYAGFVALASRGGAWRATSTDDRICSGER